MVVFGLTKFSSSHLVKTEGGGVGQLIMFNTVHVHTVHTTLYTFGQKRNGDIYILL